MKKENNALKGLLAFSGVIFWIVGVCTVIYKVFNKFFKISVELSPDDNCSDCTGEIDCTCDECEDNDFEIVMTDDETEKDETDANK